MKVTVLSEKVIMHNRIGVNNYFAWPSVTRLKDGRLAAACSGFRTWHVCPFGKAVIAFSSDEGETWSLPNVVMDTHLDDRDSGLCPFGESGLAVTSFNHTVEKAYGYLGKKAKELHAYGRAYLDLAAKNPDAEKYLGSTFRLSFDNGVTFGDVMNIPVSCPHGPAELPDGNMLYVGTEFLNRAMTGHAAAYKLYQDGTWEKLGDIPDTDDGMANDEPHTVVLNSGKIITLIRKQNAEVYTLYQSESFDGGRTWTVPHSIGLETRAGAPGHVIQKDGMLIAVYSHRVEGEYQVRAAFSCDEGETWDGDHILTNLTDKDADFGYPASVALKDGSILTVYYAADDEAKSGNVLFEIGDAAFDIPVTVIRQVIWTVEE
ncbi:MAG: exo-alpha-sialidase [Oscillospiraceae bacterium]|nr:exo-alpha-sialidase [Oscillospiraceae bacterium]